MPKLKPRMLQWQASPSAQVAFYKLYWSEEGAVDYDSDHAVVGNVTELLLPDGVEAFTPGNGPIEFGLTAVGLLETARQGHDLPLFTGGGNGLSLAVRTRPHGLDDSADGVIVTQGILHAF